MLTKTNPDDFQSYLTDSSYLPAGTAAEVVFPESAHDVATVLARASRDGIPVTVSGAGTGTVGGRVPHEGIVIATDKLDQVQLSKRENGQRIAIAGAGVILRDLQHAVDEAGLIYPPDPTERGCFIGGNVATNASGARTFKYGPTRNYVERLQVVLASGDILNIRRGELRAQGPSITIPLPSGRVVQAKVPAYGMPRVRKHATGYFVQPNMDVLDLFIGSEGTLGVVTEVEVRLLPKPLGLLSGVVFFTSDTSLLGFVREARERSFASRGFGICGNGGLDARALEYFDNGSLEFLRQRYETIPAAATGAVFFEQETDSANEDELMTDWLKLLEAREALVDDSWFATNEQDQGRLREFRHQLPVLMNEWFARHNQRKVSTDMSLPDENFPEMLRFYQDTLKASGLTFTIFGHIGDNHVHVNILPRNDDEASKAREIYVQFLKRAASLGGTLSAEHGIGKLKRDYLPLFFSPDDIRAMAALKVAFDPAGILGRGNIFPEEYLPHLG